MASSGELSFYFEKPFYKKEELYYKSSKIEGNKDKTIIIYISKAISLLEEIEDKYFEKENIKRAVWEYAEEVGRGDLLWPIRYALSGREKSPDPFILAEVLGKEETISRLRDAISILSK
jgi:glutamyl/glutaminyl-tRNA synthetase